MSASKAHARLRAARLAHERAPNSTTELELDRAELAYERAVAIDARK